MQLRSVFLGLENEYQWRHTVLPDLGCHRGVGRWQSWLVIFLPSFLSGCSAWEPYFPPTLPLFPFFSNWTLLLDILLNEDAEFKNFFLNYWIMLPLRKDVSNSWSKTIGKFISFVGIHKIFRKPDLYYSFPCFFRISFKQWF